MIEIYSQLSVSFFTYKTKKGGGYLVVFALVFQGDGRSIPGLIRHGSGG
jgi:hypothetical protein